MTAILPERMTAEERAYAEELLAGCLLKEFRTLLNDDLARQVAKFVVEKLALIQNYKGKQI